jgi:hypothetical protein
MKWLIRITVALVLIIAAVLWLVFSQFDRFVKMGIEQGGPQVLQTTVKVEKVSLSAMSATGTINGLEIGNPQGFEGPLALRIGEAEMALDTAQSQQGKIVIKHLRINEPEIHLEAGKGITNLKQIARNAEEFAAKASESVKAAGGTASAGEGQQEKKIKLQVNELTVTRAKLSASAGLLPGAAVNMTLPDIRLTNLGSGPDGISPAALTAEVLKVLSTEATKAGVGGTLGKLLQGEGGAGGASGSGLKDGFKKLLGK